jgi:RNA polymerase sigma-70 factor (ECF subfamily)
MRLWRLRKRYEASGRFAAYLFTIAHHIWRERLRAAMKDRRLGIATPAESLEGIHLTANGLAPDEAAYYAEMDERILMALRELPEEQRTAFVLRTIDGLSLEDIAQIMACPVNTVRSRRIIAIRRLREALSGLFVL